MKYAAGQLVANRYLVLAFHLEGGMQEVYRCFDQTLQRVVALKTPKEGVVDKRFSRGAQMGARIGHPNVASTLDYVEDDQNRCLIEEFIEGKDLGRRLSEEFLQLDPSLTAWVIHNIAKGLQAAHQVKICHRDLKPSNIMVSGDFQMSGIKLTDFGIAKLAESELEVEIERFGEDEKTLESSSTLLGAVPYMAPECWSDWSSAGQPADVWALGTIAYHLLFGKPPFGGGKNAIMKMALVQIAGKVELTPPDWFGKHPDTDALEKELWQIILKCLQVDPALRPSAEEISVACGALCYSAGARHTGVVDTYPITYANGSKGTAGFISVDGTGERCFFHLSVFYGSPGPKVGQRVTFGLNAGNPKPRVAPVLLLRDA
jgi:serine/threonine protein kinase